MEPPVGRRVLVAIVGGELGQHIQTWRQHHDPKQAARLPPHLTVCYRPPVEAPLHHIEAQVRYAFPGPIAVRLGPVFVLPHPEAPLAVGVHQTVELDAARRRLFDASYVEMGGRQEWPWHITCVRYGRTRDRQSLLAEAARTLALDDDWTITTISYLELRNGAYRRLMEWELTGS
jgi:hypothetical protein